MTAIRAMLNAGLGSPVPGLTSVLWETQCTWASGVPDLYFAEEETEAQRGQICSHKGVVVLDLAPGLCSVRDPLVLSWTVGDYGSRVQPLILGSPKSSCALFLSTAPPPPQALGSLSVPLVHGLAAALLSPGLSGSL